MTQEEKQKYLTLSEAASLTPYSSAYLSYLARKGKLRCIKFEDNWHTTEEWIRDYLQYIAEHPAKIKINRAEARSDDLPDGYITPAEAERIYPYSSTYLSLRIRQGKMQGVKLGNKWYTTRDWIDEYITEYAVKEPVAVEIPQQITDSNIAVIEPAIERAELDFSLDDLFFITPKLPVEIKEKKAAPPALRQRWNFNFVRPLAAVMTAVTLFFFIAPGSLWAHWGDSAVIRGLANAVTSIKETASDMAAPVGATAKIAWGLAREDARDLTAVFGNAGEKAGLSILAGLEKTEDTLANAVGAGVDFVTSTSDTISQSYLSLRAKQPIGSSISNLVSKMDSIAPQDAGLQNDNQGTVAGSAVLRNVPVSREEPYVRPSTIKKNEGPSLLARLTSSLRKGVKILSAADFKSIISRFSGQMVEISDNALEVDLATGQVAGVSVIANEVNANKIIQGANLAVTEIAGEKGRKLAVVTPVNVQPATRAAAPVTAPTTDTKLQVQTKSGATALQTTNPDKSLAFIIGSGKNLSLEQLNAGSATIGAGALQATNKSITIASPLKVKAGTQTVLGGTLSVAGLTRLYNALSVSGPTSLNDTLTTAKTIQALAGLVSEETVYTEGLAVGILGAGISGHLTVTHDTLLRSNLEVTKDALIAGNLTVAGTFNPQTIDTSFINSKTITTNHLSTGSISATGSFSAKSFSGQFGSFTNLASNSASFGGNNNDTFLSKSPSTFESTLSVTGASTLASTLALTGAATLSSTLTVSGASTLTGNTSVGGTLAVTGASTFTGALTANGGITLTGALSTSATSTASAFVSTSSSATSTIAGNLNIDKNTTISGYLNIPYLTATSTTATSTFATGGLAIGTNQFVVQQTSGRIGIGTASPLSPFHVQSSAISPQLTLAYDANNYYTTDISSAGVVSFNAYGGSMADFLFQDNIRIATSTATQLSSGYDSSNYLAFQTNSSGTTTIDAIGGQYASLIISDPLRISTSSGNAFEIQAPGNETLLTANTVTNRLGVATTTPGATFAVTGNSLFDGSLTTSGLLSANYLTATSTNATSTFAYNIGSSSGNFTLQSAGTTNNILLQPYGGNIGVGTTSPWGLLSVNAPGGKPALAVGSSTTQFIVDANGNVGIGTASPEYPLHVYKNTAGAAYTFLQNPSVDANSRVGLILGEQLAGGAYGNFAYVSTGADNSDLERIAGSFLIEGQQATGGLVMGASGALGDIRMFTGGVALTNERLRVTSTGYVGVASTTPWGLLSVEQGTEAGSFIIGNQGSSTPSFYASGVNGDGRIGIGTSTPSALLTVQEDNSTGHIVYFTDSNTVTPTFRIAATTGDIETRGDFTQGARKDLTTLANINDVFIYDTTKDSDGGVWTRNDQAQASSWYNETLDATAQSCNISTNDRCGRKEFPEKAVLVATNDNLYIFDAKDNSMWMRFDEGGTGNDDVTLLGVAARTSTSIFGLNGKLYIGRTVGSHMAATNFILDKSENWYPDGTGLYRFDSTIGNRNTGAGHTLVNSAIGIVNGNINDVHAQVINNKTYVAVGTDAGVSLINENDEKVIDFTQSTYDVYSVFLTSRGDLYIGEYDNGSLWFIRDAQNKTTDVSYNNTINVFGQGTQPAITGGNMQYRNLFVAEHSSFIDNKVGNTIFLGNAAGLNVINENYASSTLSSIKYYQTGTTTEEMIGDIRLMGHLSGTGETSINTTINVDASVKANAFTTVGAGTTPNYVTGVRGTALEFDGSDYICAGTTGTCADDDDLDFTGSLSLGAWIKSGNTENKGIISKGTLNSSTGQYFLVIGGGTSSIYFGIANDNITSRTSITNDNLWHHVAAVYNHNTSEVAVYLDGKEDGSESNWNALVNDANHFTIGGYYNTGYLWIGSIDEVFVTGTVITPSQIKHMYEVGAKALQNHTSGKITGISGADSYQQLYGASNIVKSVSVDLDNNLMYVATNDGSNGGGVSAIGLQSDTIEDIWGSDALKTDDDGTAWNADDIVSVSVSGRYPRTLVIGTDTELWQETESFSMDKYRSQSQNPHGEHLVQTNLTVNQDLAVGNSFVVYGRVLGAGVGNRHACSLQDGNCERPTFQVASDGTVSVRDDLVLNGHTNLQSLSSINDVFVYDTTKDTDGGAWTNDSNAKAASWYNEPIDNTGAGCDIISNDRCGVRAFPTKAVLTATNDALYIFDGNNNTLWMKFTEGSTATSTMSVIGGTSSTHTAVYALNGSVYLSNTSSASDLYDGGIAAIDFINDKSIFYGQQTVNGKLAYDSGLADRNSTSQGYTSKTPTLGIVDEDVNDVHTAVINNKTYVAAATGGGVSVINETDGKIMGNGYGAYAFTKVFIAGDGTLYYGHSTYGQIKSTYKIQTLLDRFSAHASYYGGASPAPISDNVQGVVNDLYVTTGASFVDGKSNTIYIATKEDTQVSGAGLTRLDEKQGDETNGAVKYYTQDYISEEMVGDIRGMWTFGEGSMLDDVSVKTNGLAATNITTADLVSGVRGTGIDFDGSSEYLSCTDAVCGGTSGLDYSSGSGWSLGVWIKPSVINSAYHLIMSKWPEGGQNSYYLAITSNNVPTLALSSDGTNGNGASSNTILTTGQWYYIVGTYDGAYARFYLNGELTQTSAAASSSIYDGTGDFYIGKYSPGFYYGGTLDEPFVTAEALTPAQIKYMYESGKRALEQKALSTTSDATAVGNDRLGDSGLAVTADDYIGSFIEITGGTGVGQTRRIIDNDTTTFFVDTPFDVTPDTTSDFQILANQIYIKDSSTATTVQSVYVDKDAGVMYVGVNNSDNTGGVTAIGLDSDTILDIWHNQAGKVDDLGNNWNADDIVAIGAASDGGGGSSRHPELVSGSDGSRNEFGMTSGILAIGTDAELWAQSSGQTLNALTSAGTSPIKNVLIVKDQATFQGKFKITDNEGQSILSIDESSKNINIREGIEFGSNTKLTNLSNINDIYVYDTSKDSDGGEWTCNDIAEATSWYNEALNTSTRGKTRCFPRKAVIVGTTGAVYIFDAKDNSEWMEFDDASDNTTATITGWSNANHAAVFALNGKVYVAGNSGSSWHQLLAVDFKKDGATMVNTTDENRFSQNIAQRNSQANPTALNPNVEIVNAYVNDVHAAVINGKTYVAVATDSGVSIINESDSTVVDITEYAAANEDLAVVILPNGNIYRAEGDDTTINYIEAFYTIPTADITYASRNYFISTGSTPGWLSNGVLEKGLFVTQGTSSIDGKSNTLYIAKDESAVVFQEKQGDETNGSVKYYTKDYISEEMVGDIRGMWPMQGYPGGETAINTTLGGFDASVKANAMTTTGAGTTPNYVAGVRGTALEFDGGDTVCTGTAGTCADDADLDVYPISMGAWVKSSSSALYAGIINKYTNGSADGYLLMLYEGKACGFYYAVNTSNKVFGAGGSGCDYGTATYIDGNWHMLVYTIDAAGGRMYVDGTQVGSQAWTGTPAADTSADALRIGKSYGGNLTGVIDDPFVTAEALTASQIKRMYETGKRALEGGTEGTADDTTSAHSAFRIGVGNSNKYSAGQFIGSIIQVYDGPGSATSTRFVTQTASSTADYYVQFSPDHSATIADNDTFSIGPNALQGSSNRVTAIAVDEYADFIYIGSTDATGVNGMVTKIALDSDTVTDVWHPTVGKTDDYKQPFATASTTAISIVDNTLAIGANDTNSGGFWSETGAESLDRKLSKPKTVFTVIDNIQTPRITSVTGNLTISSATSTSLTIGTATTTAATIQIKAGPSQNLLLSGDSNNGVYVAGSSGYVGIGTMTPAQQLHLQKTAASSFIEIDGAAASQSGLIFDSGGTSKWQLVRNADSSLNFYDYAGTAGVRMMIQSSTGYVGIGTTDPGEKLEIYGGHLRVSTGNGPYVKLKNTNTGQSMRGTIAWYGADSSNSGAEIYSEGGNDSTDATMTFSTRESAGAGGVLRERVRITSTGNVGIGDATPTEGTLVVGDAGAGSIYATFAAANSAALCFDGSGASLITDCTSGPSADYAEMYPVENNVEYGDIMMLGDAMVDTYSHDGNEVDWNKVLGQISKLKKATDASKMIGVLSNNRFDFSSTGYNIKDQDNPQPVALNGRIITKVNTENGAIKIGDYLTLSSTPGVAAKLKGSGYTIGRALSSYSGQGQGVILVFANLFYKSDVESFVPIWDGKIEGVVGEIKKLKEEDVKIKKRLEVIEKKIK